MKSTVDKIPNREQSSIRFFVNRKMILSNSPPHMQGARMNARALSKDSNGVSGLKPCESRVDRADFFRCFFCRFFFSCCRRRRHFLDLCLAVFDLASKPNYLDCCIRHQTYPTAQTPTPPFRPSPFFNNKQAHTDAKFTLKNIS